MMKKQFSTIAIQVLLSFLLVGCTSGVPPTSDPLRVLTPSPTPVQSVSVITFPTSTMTFPDGNSILQEWDFDQEGLIVYDAFITNYGRHLVAAFDNPTLMVHNFETGQEQIFRSPVDFAFLDLVDGISSNPAGVVVVEYSLNESGDVTLWQISEDGESRVTAKLIETEYFLTAMEISPDGKTLALGYNNGEIRLFQTSDGTPICTIQAHHDFVMSLAFSWDSHYLLSDSCCFDPFTHVFDASDGSKVVTLAEESYEPGRISFSPDNQFVAVTSYDGTHIHSTASWKDLGFVIPTFEGKFACDSQGLIAVAEGAVNIYSMTGGDIIQTSGAWDFHCLFNGQTITIDVDTQDNSVTLHVVED